jgi:hypothetical protein
VPGVGLTGALIESEHEPLTKKEDELLAVRVSHALLKDDGVAVASGAAVVVNENDSAEEKE